MGSHSLWISRLLEQQGHEVVVANARRVRLIGESSRKNDHADAELLARLVRADAARVEGVRCAGEFLRRVRMEAWR